MEIGILIGVMATVCVVATYFWLVRSKNDVNAKANAK